MSNFRKITCGLLASAMLAGAATPAFADRGGFGGGWGGERRHHDHDDHTGAVIAGVLGIGILAAIIGSASDNSNRHQQAEGNYPAPPLQPQNANGYYQYNGQQYQQITNENLAVDACAAAAEQQGGRMASVRNIRDVHSTSTGWDVKGTIEQRSSYRNDGSNTHNFNCKVRSGAIESLRIENDLADNN